jgi:tRNA nucleotidyltransferase (CCA-adding enzyme)
MDFPQHIKVYIVGGYVRDRLLSRECKDHDFVVVGATEQDMLDLGFSSVGADFPVFLHPLTGDEFALARKERKVAAGYNGFEVDFDPSVTLEDDLKRRDLTINAMAREVVGWNDQGHAKLKDDVIDPLGVSSIRRRSCSCSSCC